MLAVLLCSTSLVDETDICDAYSETDTSSFCFGFELKAEEQISLLKSLVIAKFDSFSGNVIIRCDRILFNDSTIIKLS